MCCEQALDSEVLMTHRRLGEVGKISERYPSGLALTNWDNPSPSTHQLNSFSYLKNPRDGEECSR
jgi:hypothetical protein